MKKSKSYIFKRQLLTSLKDLQTLKFLLALLFITIKPQSDVGDVIKNINASASIELTKSTLLNSKLQPNKILDEYSNVNKIYRFKDEINDSNLKIKIIDRVKFREVQS